MSDTVLVTGGFGLAGSATVLQLAADNRRVVIADLEAPGNVKKAQALPGRVEVRWTDLTDPTKCNASSPRSHRPRSSTSPRSSRR